MYLFFSVCALKIKFAHISSHKEFTCVPICRGNLWICMKYDFIICLQSVWKNVAGKFRPRFMPKYQIRQDEICGKIAFETSVVCIYYLEESNNIWLSNYHKKPNSQCFYQIFESLGNLKIEIRLRKFMLRIFQIGIAMLRTFFFLQLDTLMRNQCSTWLHTYQFWIKITSSRDLL